MYQIVVARLIRFLSFAGMVLILSACGQGSGPEPVAGTPQVPQTGVLLDSPVAGVSWESSSGASGVTNDAGEFSYLPFETITFSIGGITLGSVEAAPFVTVVELTNSVVPTSQAAVNMLVFLQSIDTDGDPSNGINVDASGAGGLSLDFFADDFATRVTAVIAAMAGDDALVVSEGQALNHFYSTYVAMGGTDTFSFTFPGYPPVGGVAETFELTFADEFDQGDAPDSTKWNFETGYGPNNSGWGNNEWQLYTDNPENVRVEDGNLVIQARCDTPPCGSRDGSITSARITTLNKFNFKFGKVVARIKPPVGSGAWPAFWALGANFPDIGWPRSGEIDFMEMHNAFSDEFTTHSTIHWCDESIQAPQTCSFPDGWVFFTQNRSFPTSLGDDFQVWEADWDENGITMSMNGVDYFFRAIEPDTMEEFLEEFFMILNVAMGGTLGSNNQPPTGNEVWPQTMLVDYVRVFQKVGGTSSTTQVIDFEDDPETYNFGPSGGFGGGASAVIPNPVSEGINTSAQVGRMLKFEGEVFAGSLLELADPIVVPSGSNFTMKVWSPRPVPVLFKLEGETESERSVMHSGSGWEELTFDFGTYSGTAAGISLIFDLGVVGDAGGDPDNWTFYFDDIVFNPASTGGGPVGGGGDSFPLDFEDAAESYNFGAEGGFGGGASAVVPNPVPDNNNSSSQVARMLKFSGEVFAGSLLELPTALDVVADSSFTMNVWSPREVRVLFKLEGDTDAEIEVTHSGSGWETLTYDFGSYAGSVQGITFIFDLGVVGDAGGDPDNWTFYYDDIDYIPGGSGGGDPGGGDDGFGGDFEAASATYDFGAEGGFGGGAVEVLDNPVPGGINTSAQVARMLKFQGEPFAGSTWALPTALDVMEGSQFTMKVWSPRAVMVLLKLEGPNEMEINLPHGGTGWEELTYDFSSFSGAVEGFTLIFDLGIVGDAMGDPDNWTFYFDDITLVPPGTGGGPGGGGLAQVSLPITFDDAGVDYSVVDFGSPVAAMTTLVADPEDASNTVASTIKPMGAPVWAGTTMSTTDGLAQAIPFTVNDTTIGVRVYSPDAGIPVRLKADNVVNGTISVETETLTTVANEWETLIFDFANPVADTPALDVNTQYRALSIFFNFGTSGDEAGSKTYLWDDVEFDPEPPADTTAPMLTSVSVTSSNSDTTVATVGDLITVAFTADEPITMPMVMIAGSAADAVTGEGVEWMATRTLTADDAEGPVTFAISFSDAAGNAGAAVTQTSDASSVTLDATVPSLAISGLAASLNSLAPVTLTFQFSEDVSGFELSDIAVVNGEASDLASSDAATYTAIVTPTADGALSVDVADAAAQDAAGNSSTAAAAQAQVDTIAPVVTIEGVPADFATLDPVTVTFQFSEVVDGFDLTDINVTNGAADSFVVVDGDTYTAAITPDGAGDLIVSVAAGAASDAAGNVTPALVDATALIDAVVPTLTITGVPADFTTLDPISVTFTFSEAVSGFDLADIQVTNGVASNFVAVDATVYTADVTPDGAGDLSVAVAADAAQDGVGNPSVADDASSAIDAVEPTVTITGGPADFASLDPISLTFQFSEAVTGFALEDITVTNGAASALVVVDESTFTANVTPNGNGDLSIAVAANVAQDGVGNGNTASATVVVTNNLDTEAPLLTSVSIASNNAASDAFATAGDIVTVSLTANEDIGEPVVTINGQAADTVTGSGPDWQATRALQAGDAEGPVVFTLDFSDLDGNVGPQSTVTTDSSSVVFDVTAPTVSINGLPATFEMLDPLTATFQFSEDVTGFALTDIGVTNGAASAFTSVDASTYTAVVTPDGNGSMTVSVAAGAAQDLAGLQSVMPTDVVVANDVDVDAPMLTVVSIASDNANTTLASTGDTVTVTLMADEDIVEPTVTIGGAAATVSGSGASYTASRVLLASDAEGAVAFTIDFTDLVGNDGTQVTATTDASVVTFDRTEPSLVITGLSATFTSLDPIAMTFTFSEDVTGFELADVVVTNGTADAIVEVDGATYTANVTPDGQGDLTVAVAADAAADLAGNTSTAASETATPDLPPAYELVWSDSFDGAALDSANWTARSDADCPTPCEDGEQSYNTSTVSVAGGVLTIEAQDTGGSNFVSGFIDSLGKRELKYGRVEIDAILPGTQGTAPALLMLPVSDVYGAWPLSGEIDIAKAPDLDVGGNSTVEQALVYGLPTPETTTTSGSYDSPAAPTSTSITYAMEWEEGEIRWFVGDVHVLTQSDENWYSYGENDDGVYEVGAGAAPFDENFYLALTVAVTDSTDGTSTFPQSLVVDEVRVFECARSPDPATGTGCSTGDPAVTPVSAPSEPFAVNLDLYVDGPATVGFIDEMMVSTDGQLVATTQTSSGSVNVLSNPSAADPDGGTLWSLSYTASAGTGDAVIQPGDFSGSDAFFNVTGGDAAGELLFRMRVNSVTGSPTLSAGMDDAAGGSGEADLTFTADGQWQQYSVKIADVVTDSVANATALNLANVSNVFRLSVSGGSATLDIDDVQIKVACRDTDGCDVTPSLTEVPLVVRYQEDFETFILADNMTPLEAGEWKFFNAVFTAALANPLFTYFGDAPNGPQMSAIAGDQGGVEQGQRQLSVYSDYECCQPNSGHNDANGTVESNIFREETLTAADVGKTLTFTFNAKRGNIEGGSQAFAFIKVLDPNGGFSETTIDEIEMTSAPDSWLPYEAEITIGDWEGQLLQFGFRTTAGGFEGSGIFYDNLLVTEQ